MRSSRLLIMVYMTVLGTNWVLAQPRPDAFVDAKKDHWAYEAMEHLRSRGVVIGYPDGHFRGNRTLTRYEFAVALNRAIGGPAPFIAGVQGPAGERGPAGSIGPQGERGPAGV